MLRQLIAFEFRHAVRQPLFWGTAAAFAALGFVATVTDALQLGGAIGSVNRNAPYVVVRMLGDLTLVGIFMVVAFVAAAVVRDFERHTDELIFSRPVSPAQLLLGRFIGSLAAACACFAAAPLGMIAGTLSPLVDPERVGPLSVRPYLFALFVLAYPTFTIVGASFFAVATRVRHLAATYVALVALLVAYFAATAMAGDLEGRAVAGLLDPFGLTGFDVQTRYWTIAEKNTRLPAIAGALLWSRIFWLALALGVLAWAVATFRYESLRTLRSKGVRPPARTASAIARVRRRPAFTHRTVVAQFAAQTMVESRAILLSLPFLLIAAFGLINVLANMGYLELMMGTPVWPVTHLMLLAISSGYSMLLVLVLGFYAGEVVWRERSIGIDGIVDATPIPTWLPIAAKLVGLSAAAAVFLIAGAAGLAGYQLVHGYTRLEPVVYAQGLLIEIVPFLQLAALFVLLQALANQKYVAYLLAVLVVVARAVLPQLGLDHHLYRYATTPVAFYSDMNGWGHFAAAVFWFDLYWSLAAAISVYLAYACWIRGAETGWKVRLSVMRRRLIDGRVLLALCVVALASVGAWIFFNTNVRNEYVSPRDAERRQAEYEKRYRRYREIPQPRIQAISARVDLYPDERRADIRAVYQIANLSNVPIRDVHVTTSPRVRVMRLVMPAHTVVLDDERLGYAIYRLRDPLAPGQRAELTYDLEISNPGFVNGAPDNSVVANGTFFHSRQFPAFGYQDGREIGDPSLRRRQGLPPASRMAKRGDVRARMNNDLASDADLIAFDTTVSTSADQIAVAPGELMQTWVKDGRRYFHYRTPGPIPKFFAYLSGRYAVRRDSWNGTRIEVWHHPTHTFNVDRMVDAARKTLQYMTGNFSPYQHGVIRIVEFPRYVRVAASFPNTIPFSESIGFIARLNDRNAIDYPFYVTAHEVAHQWWGYQVLGADVQGSAMLSESMAQYAALMVMKHEYGAETMRRFLKYELDGYLSGRGGELIEELPLELVENQPYIHYRKGSLALYALQDALGEGTLNAALRRYIASVSGKVRPYTVSSDLLSFVREVTPRERQPLLHDLFESITLFEVRTISAHARPAGNGRYEVTIDGAARKFRADGLGHESEVAIDDWIDVGVFAPGGQAPGRVLRIGKYHVSNPHVEVRMTVDGVPAMAGIDPYNILIDRTPSDNLHPVSISGQ